jgi:hypothetical protein
MPRIRSVCIPKAAGPGPGSFAEPTRERAVSYKLSCPACGRRVSRWHAFTEPTLFHRCRGCGTLLRAAWAGTLLVVAVEIAWFVLYRMRIISALTAIGLLLLTFALAVWLLPYFTPAIVKQRAEAENR